MWFSANALAIVIETSPPPLLCEVPVSVLVLPPPLSVVPLLVSVVVEPPSEPVHPAIPSAAAVPPAPFRTCRREYRLLSPFDVMARLDDTFDTI
jgi:hypothetical protein